MVLANSFVERRANQLLQSGLDFAQCGETSRARDEFRASAGLVPTAEALTFWGWMEFHLGRAKEAIKLCRKAIAVDPDFGNPYNDIGSYLVSLGRSEEAVEWFHKAIESKRYESRQFPHVNLGKIYLEKNQYRKALAHFEAARKIRPSDREISRIIDVIKTDLV
jgi:tetratricopeptide (TPR) repeat protein